MASKSAFLNFILFLVVVGLRRCGDFSLVAIRGYSVVVAHGLLIVVAFLVAEHRL